MNFLINCFSRVIKKQERDDRFRW